MTLGEGPKFFSNAEMLHRRERQQWAMAISQKQVGKSRTSDTVVANIVIVKKTNDWFREIGIRQPEQARVFVKKIICSLFSKALQNPACKNKCLPNNVYKSRS